MTAMGTARVERSFSRSFASYHDTASQQSRIAGDLAARLARHGAPGMFRNGFEIGCGTGHLTRALCRRFSFARLSLNDLVPEAQATAAGFGARFLPGDAREITWPERPDLIASASVIQWMEHPQEFLARAGQALAPGGWLAISGFGPDQYRELADLGSGAHAPGLCHARALAAALPEGFEILDAGEERRALWFDGPRDVLGHLRRTGVNGRAGDVWTRSRLARFCESYLRDFGKDGAVPLSYHPVWIIARKRP